MIQGYEFVKDKETLNSEVGINLKITAKNEVAQSGGKFCCGCFDFNAYPYSGEWSEIINLAGPRNKRRPPL